jgi:excisionase family DNA binding protein
MPAKPTPSRPDASQSPFVSVPEVARFLGISVVTAYNLVNSGMLPSYHMGGRGSSIRVKRQDLEDYLESVRLDATHVPPPSPRSTRKSRGSRSKGK